MAIRRLCTRQDGTWAWQLVVDGEIVATDGGQGYANEAEARDMVNRILGGEFADAERRIRRAAPTAEQKPKSSANEPSASKARGKQSPAKKVPAKGKTVQKPGSRASTSGQYQPKRGGDEVTVPKGHRLPPGRRKGEQWVNADPTKNKSGRRAEQEKQAPAKKTPAKNSGKASSKVTRGAYTSADVRAWARRNGYDVSDRGTIPKHISSAYRAAQRP